MESLSLVDQLIKPNMMYIVMFFIVVIGIGGLKAAFELKQQKKIQASGIVQVDQMKGEEFEAYLSTILRAKAYKVEMTPKSGDYGADLVLRKHGKKIVVQAKRYKNKVGVRAVQEIVSAKKYYQADACWVITNNYFTQPANNLAQVNEVRLINRDELIKWMQVVNG